MATEKDRERFQIGTPIIIAIMVTAIAAPLVVSYAYKYWWGIYLLLPTIFMLVLIISLIVGVRKYERNIS